MGYELHLLVSVDASESDHNTVGQICAANGFAIHGDIGREGELQLAGHILQFQPIRLVIYSLRLPIVLIIVLLKRPNPITLQSLKHPDHTNLPQPLIHLLNPPPLLEPDPAPQLGQSVQVQLVVLAQAGRVELVGHRHGD